MELDPGMTPIAYRLKVPGQSSPCPAISFDRPVMCGLFGSCASGRVLSLVKAVNGGKGDLGLGVCSVPSSTSIFEVSVALVEDDSWMPVPADLGVGVDLAVQRLLPRVPGGVGVTRDDGRAVEVSEASEGKDFDAF